jgi:hypothetical protein
MEGSMRTLIGGSLVLLTLLTGLAAVLVAGFAFTSGDDAPGSRAAKIALCAGTIASGAILLAALRGRGAGDAGAARMRGPLPQGARWGAGFLMVLGAAGIPYTLHLAHATGDLEAWAIAIHGAMLAQGALGLVLLRAQGDVDGPSRPA